MGSEITSTTMLVRGEECEVDGYVSFTVENDYGADADGNRGVAKIIVDDVTSIEAYDYNGDNVTLNPDEIEIAAQQLTNKFLER